MARWSIHALVNKVLIIAPGRLSLRMVACHYTGPLVIARTAYLRAGPHIIALVGLSLRWTAYLRAGPHIIALDRSDYSCDGPLMLATAYLRLRRPTYSSAGPNIKAPVRRS
jgi:hypothetical protein